MQYYWPTLWTNKALSSRPDQTTITHHGREQGDASILHSNDIKYCVCVCVCVCACVCGDLHTMLLCVACVMLLCHRPRSLVAIVSDYIY